MAGMNILDEIFSDPVTTSEGLHVDLEAAGLVHHTSATPGVKVTMPLMYELFGRPIILSDGTVIDSSTLPEDWTAEAPEITAHSDTGETLNTLTDTLALFLPGTSEEQEAMEELVLNLLSSGDFLENFDPSQARDHLGRFASGASSLAGEVFHKVSYLEHSIKEYTKDKVSSSVAKLPRWLQLPVMGIFHVLRAGTAVAFATWSSGQALAERVAKEKGASPEQARRLRGILTSLDITTFKPLSLALHVSGVHASTLGAVGLLPPASTCYLAYSTARNPLATLRAAKGLVRDVASKVVGHRRSEITASIAHVDDELGLIFNALSDSEQMEMGLSLAQDLKDHGYSDWYIALLSAALDETKDVVRAAELANEAFDEQDEDPEPEPQSDDAFHALGIHPPEPTANMGPAILGLNQDRDYRASWATSDAGPALSINITTKERNRLTRIEKECWKKAWEKWHYAFAALKKSMNDGTVTREQELEVERLGEHLKAIRQLARDRTAGGVDFADLDTVLDNLATNAVRGPNPWAPYVGPRGGRGWKNTNTGRIFYGAIQPGSGVSTGGPAPVPAPAPGVVSPAPPPVPVSQPRTQRADPASVKAHVTRLLANPSRITAADIHEVKEELLSMTVAQVQTVKKDLGIKASGGKALQAARVAQLALSGSGRPTQPQAPSPHPAQPQSPSHAPPQPVHTPSPHQPVQPPSPRVTPHIPQPQPAQPPQHQPAQPQPAHPAGGGTPSPLHRGANVITGAPAQAPTALPVVPHKHEIEWSTGKPQPGTLNGVDFAPAPHHFWEHVKDKDISEPPPTRPINRVGVMVQEPDGRIWIVKPTNEYGDRKYTMPGGGAEPGLTHQQNALKEVWEETGLQVEITGHLGDFRDSNNGNNGRLYIGRRVGGAPWDAKVEAHIIDKKTGKPAAESSEVVLATPERARKLLHRSDDLAQLMTVSPIPLNTSTRGRGSEPLKKLLEAVQPAARAYKKAKQSKGQTAGNAELHAIQDIRGFNAKPAVVDKKDMDALVAKGGHIEVLRGLSPHGTSKGSDLADQFREGDHYPGFGCFGSGTYADSTKGLANAASGYAGYGSGGAIMRIALPKTAKIIKQSELEKKVPVNPEDFKGYQSSQGGYSAREEWHGVQAALAGYDAIEVDGKSSYHYSYGKGYYVILNRSVLTVQKEDATGHLIS